MLKDRFEYVGPATQSLLSNSDSFNRVDSGKSGVSLKHAVSIVDQQTDEKYFQKLKESRDHEDQGVAAKVNEYVDEVMLTPYTKKKRDKLDGPATYGTSV